RGIRVKILTGDNRHVAQAVARAVGLADDSIVTGAQLQAMQRPGPEAAGTSASSASSGTTGAQSHTDAHHAATSASDSALAPAGANPVAPSQELNALAIVWGLIKRFFAGLFGSSK
ncbi:MAG: hypothetical protein EBX57_03565, partial [Betaproteobacteria bacterium]|nr:hypothetical protein [Betaproteobacteria bacterium]